MLSAISLDQLQTTHNVVYGNPQTAKIVIALESHDSRADNGLLVEMLRRVGAITNEWTLFLEMVHGPLTPQDSAPRLESVAIQSGTFKRVAGWDTTEAREVSDRFRELLKKAKSERDGLKKEKLQRDALKVIEDAAPRRVESFFNAIEKASASDQPALFLAGFNHALMGGRGSKLYRVDELYERFGDRIVVVAPHRCTQTMLASIGSSTTQPV